MKRLGARSASDARAEIDAAHFAISTFLLSEVFAKRTVSSGLHQNLEALSSSGEILMGRGGGKATGPGKGAPTWEEATVA